MCDATRILPLMVLIIPILMLNACAPGSIISRCIFNICDKKCAHIDLKQAKCPYGYAMDSCGVTFCAKGPGDTCWAGLVIGHPHYGTIWNSHYGICGRGLTCGKCGRCTGCSIAKYSKSNRVYCFDAKYDC